MNKFDYRLLAIFVVLVPPSVLGSVIAVDHVAFTTAPQTILPGEISGIINIQTQDFANSALAVGETADLLLTTTSGTGEFSSSATTWVVDNTLTMSSTWANRSFYYRDVTPGDYILTAVLTGRISGANWQTTQEIVVTPEPVTGAIFLSSLITGGLFSAPRRRV